MIPLPERPAPRPTIRRRIGAVLVILTARALGYGMALALVGGLLWAGVGAMASAGTIGPGDYVASTLPPFATPEPTAHPKAPKATPHPKATAKPHRTAAPILEPAGLDCDGMDPQDPNIEPDWDCVP